MSCTARLPIAPAVARTASTWRRAARMTSPAASSMPRGSGGRSAGGSRRGSCGRRRQRVARRVAEHHGAVVGTQVERVGDRGGRHEELQSATSPRNSGVPIDAAREDQRHEVGEAGDRPGRVPGADADVDERQPVEEAEREGPADPQRVAPPEAKARLARRERRVVALVGRDAHRRARLELLHVAHLRGRVAVLAGAVRREPHPAVADLAKTSERHVVSVVAGRLRLAPRRASRVEHFFRFLA